MVLLRRSGHRRPPRLAYRPHVVVLCFLFYLYETVVHVFCAVGCRIFGLVL